ncbi:MAG: hypothetical protein ICV63_19885 [Coleofasciculus sp. Co-bin14]|nr:hypothetical protein [Coleofasciculus sp. Co-bin14]
MNITKEFAFIIAVVSLLVTTLATLPLWAKQNVETGKPMEGNVGQNVNHSQATEAEQYWTQDRMDNAQPSSMTRPGSPKPVSQPQSPSSPEVSGSSSSSGDETPPNQK